MDLYTKLKSLRRDMKHRFRKFPYECCYQVARELHLREGFLIVEGDYIGRVDDRFARRFSSRNVNIDCIEHFIAFDPFEALYCDLTASQFSLDNLKILIMQYNDRRLLVGQAEQEIFHIYRPRYMWCVGDPSSLNDVAKIDKDGWILTPAPRELVPRYISAPEPDKLIEQCMITP
jgi:hypothetical protein